MLRIHIFPSDNRRKSPNPGIIADSCPQQTAGSQKQQKIPQVLQKNFQCTKSPYKIYMLNAVVVWTAEEKVMETRYF